MNIDGTSGANFHGGDTLVEGDLTVEGKITANNFEGQSEYLDSGVYTPTITTITAGWSFTLSIVPPDANPIYEKNGNIVTLGVNILAGWTGATTSFASFRISVPSIDLFDLKVTNKAYASAGIKGIYTVSRVSKSAGLDNSYDIELNAETPFTFLGSGRFSLILTYKLDAPDVPATAIVSGGGGSSDVKNPMLSDLDAGGFSISNIDTVTANQINAPNVITNPLTSVLDANNLAIINLSAVTGSGGETKFGGDRLRDVSEVSNSGVLTLTGGVNITLTGPSITLNAPNTLSNGNLIMNSNLIDDCPAISNTTGGDIKIGTDASHLYETSGPEKKIIQQCDRLTENGATGPANTVHIYDSAGLFDEPTIIVSGQPYYELQDNTTYVIHGNITLTQGFYYGVNSAIFGEGINCSITFDESKNDIVGFKAFDQDLFLSNITVIGGGMRFSGAPTANNPGLFSFTNVNPAGSPPFYGRSKRCRIQNCQIIAPYSLGSIIGGGTLRIGGCFFNGGGGTPSGVYTERGLEVSDGLSFEFTNNKMVLMKGAQAASSLKMLDLVDSIPLLGFNAVIIAGNIFHPRDQENAIRFGNNSSTQLGTISANTFIRSGGISALIFYQNQPSFDNYNVKAIERYELNGNAGIINSSPVLEIATGAHNAISSATWIDLDIPITSIQPLDQSKRFALKFVATGVTGGAYRKGNFLESTTSPTIRGYIVDVQTVLAGTDIVYITDMNGVFPDQLGYREVDASLSPTGVASSGLDIGDNSNNIELYYFDRDPHDVQFGLTISYENDVKDSEVQFRLSKDTGGGYSPLDNSIIQATNARQNKGDSTSLIHLVRMNYGELIKLEYQYIDAVNTTINRLNWTGK